MLSFMNFLQWSSNRLPLRTNHLQCYTCRSLKRIPLGHHILMHVHCTWQIIAATTYRFGIELVQQWENWKYIVWNRIVLDQLKIVSSLSNSCFVIAKHQCHLTTGQFKMKMAQCQNPYSAFSSKQNTCRTYASKAGIDRYKRLD